MINKSRIKASAIFALAVSMILSGCSDIKFIELASETTPSSQTGDVPVSLSSENTDDDWKTQTLATTTHSYQTVSPSEHPQNPIQTDSETTTRKSGIITTTSPEQDDSYFTDIEPIVIKFIKPTTLYEKATDTDPFKIRAGMTAELIGYSIDEKWDVIKFSGNRYLVIADSGSYEIYTESTKTETTTRETTTAATTEKETVTTAPTDTETTTESTTTTSAATTSATTTTVPTTTTTVPTTTTTPPPTTTTVTTTTTPPPITTKTTTTTAKPADGGLVVTGNVGGVEFPDDTSKTSLVFGITFVNMDTQIYLLNDVYASSGPGYPSIGNGYINLGKLEAGTEMKCIGMSYDGWLRVRMPNGKIGFVREEDAAEF